MDPGFRRDGGCAVTRHSSLVTSLDPVTKETNPMLSVPRATIADAEHAARTLYGWSATAQSLPGERDANFLLTLAGGDKRVLKFANDADGAVSVDMQLSALLHLENSNIRAPRVARTVAGETSRRLAIGNGESHTVWGMTHLDGEILARRRQKSAALLEQLGREAGLLSLALREFKHPVLSRPFPWELSHGGEVVRQYRPLLGESPASRSVDKLLARAEESLGRVQENLPRQAIHNDLNDYNLLIHSAQAESRYEIGIVDFGDMVHSIAVGELAVLLAYVLLDEANPLAAASHVMRGYHAHSPLSEAEISAIFPLVCMRMCLSLAIGAHQVSLQPENLYLDVSTVSMQRAVNKLAGIGNSFAEGVFRNACGLEASAHASRVRAFLHRNTANFASVLPVDARRDPVHVLALSIESPLINGNAALNDETHLSQRVFAEIHARNADMGIGRYDEARLLYTAPFFALSEHELEPRRTIHIGLDLFLPAGTPVHAPLDGVICAAANNATSQDYGPVIILRHSTDDGASFFTLYGHLSQGSLTNAKVGRAVAKGERFATLGTPEENVGWTPHLHLQVITDLCDWGTDFPGVGDAELRAVWKSFSPDPNLIVGVPAAAFPARDRDTNELLRDRLAVTGHNLKVSYRKPLNIVRGFMQHLYDETGRKYLDGFNNVPHAGHSHPRVAARIAEQVAVLNTNTRYLHGTVVEYSERLVATLPAPLSVCYLVTSGSEATELAARLAQTHTKRRAMIVLDGAYHGNTNAAIDLSPYKHNGPGGKGPPDWVHTVAQPDMYRGPFRDGQAGLKYAELLDSAIEKINAGRRAPGVAAFLAETCPSVGGQIIPPSDYFREAYKRVRAAGGLCIADEVQTGFGRMGRNFWAFEDYDVIPDIVVLGKPMGNGYPIGAVVTTREIADSFDNGMEFFSTFGGSTVAAAAGLAVLDVLRDEKLQQNAQLVGDKLFREFIDLIDIHENVGNVRGSGLFWGVELVTDRESREPATRQTSDVVQHMRESGVLIGSDGPYDNVLKIRPPMVFSDADAELLAQALSNALHDCS